MSVSMMFSLGACSGSSDGGSTDGDTTTTAGRTKEEDEVTVADLGEKYPNDVDISGQEIVWMADYDINPSNNDDRSVALTLFEDTYGGKVKWIQTTSATKFDDLANKIMSDEQVDMFPYEWSCLPNGVYKDQYEPLDDYINLKAKVETRMKIVDMTATGDDNILSDEERTDLEYRKAQLKRLQDEVVDIEDMLTWKNDIQIA